MRTLFLHVGIEKTGTSSIQNFLNTNRELLLKEKILYPKTGLWNDGSHHELAFSILQNSQRGQFTPMSTILEQLKTELDDSDPDTVIISSEILRKVFNYEKSKPFIEEINSIFDQVTLIIYIRRQDKWFESMYKQRVRDPITAYKFNIHEFINKFSIDANYDLLLKNWRRLLGREANIIVRKYYEKNEDPEFSSTNDFINLLKLDNLSIKIPNIKKNKSLPDSYVNILRILNNIPISASNRAYLNYSISKLPNISLFNGCLNKETRNNLQKAYSESNESIREKYFSNLEQLFPIMD